MGSMTINLDARLTQSILCKRIVAPSIASLTAIANGFRIEATEALEIDPMATTITFEFSDSEASAGSPIPAKPDRDDAS